MMMRRNMRWSLAGGVQSLIGLNLVRAVVGIKADPVHILAFKYRGFMAGRSQYRDAGLRLFLHVLDVGKIDALGALAGVAEIEFVLGHEHRVAVDVVGDAGI